MNVLTPPMGWNSWNTFAEHIDEKIVLESADTLVNTGLSECGYNYIVIDDCWSLKERDENGKLVPDPEKFPHGMKYVADYVHSKGLKFGMYSCAGTLTCAGYPGSFDHEWDDAKSFAEWGVDFLKYDYCFHPETLPPDILYKRMSVALQNSGRDILLSACSWGADNTREWVAETGSNMWRATEDIFESWASIKKLGMVGLENARYGRINCYSDLDMLVVGMHGNGNVGLSGCTDDEYKLHFALWALMGSPLMIGCDIRNMDDMTKSILMNKDIIAINQDADQNVPYKINSQRSYEVDVYAKLLSNGDFAIGVFNFTDDTSDHWWNSNFMTDKIGIPESSGKTLLMKELYTGEEVLVKNGIYMDSIPAHSCKIFRAKVVDK